MAVDLLNSIIAILDKHDICFEEMVNGEVLSIPVSSKVLSVKEPLEKIRIIEDALNLLKLDVMLRDAKTDLKDISKINLASVDKYFKKLFDSFRILLASKESMDSPDVEFAKIEELEKMINLKLVVGGN